MVGNAQKIYKIEVDSIHCQGTNCYLLNFTGNKIYSCDFEYLQISEYRYEQAIECFFDRDFNEIRPIENLLKLKRITDYEEFKKWTNSLKFISKYEVKKVKHEIHFQSINSSHGILSQKPYLKKEGYEIVPIQINNEYFIAGLIKLGDKEIDHLIFPDKERSGLMYYANRLYQPTEVVYDIDQSIKKEIFNSYRVRKSKSKRILTNSNNSTPILKGTYDEIVLSYPYVILKNNDKVRLLSEDLNDITLENLIEAYDCFGSIQIIYGGKMKWLDLNKNIVDTMPTIERVLDCGMVPCYQKRIELLNDEYHEIVFDCEFEYVEEYAEIDTFKFNIGRELLEVKYLNDSKSNRFSVECFTELFCHPSNLYYFKTKSNTEGIFKRINEKEEQISSIWNNDSFSYEFRKARVKLLRDSLKITYRDEIIIEDKYDKFDLFGYNHPIIYKQKGSYGIFPQMKVAKYSFIDKFVGNLARVMLMNGEQGWIDLNGQEIKNE
jgi:hypothetical protein